jgi:hypothetical protein
VVERRQVAAKDLAPGAALKSDWPELDARIATLEQQVAEDEERIKQMISAPSVEGSDPLIHSPELREIASRLPILQGELYELRRWRDQPDNR